MSRNRNTDSTEQEAEQAGTMDLAAAQRVEQEKMTRRAALRKLGFGAGLAAFSLLGVDDFARMVGQRLQRDAHDNKTAMAVAKEFQQAGIVLASPSSGGTPTPGQAGAAFGKACLNSPSGCTKCLRGSCISKYGYFGFICPTDCQTCVSGGFSSCGG